MQSLLKIFPGRGSVVEVALDDLNLIVVSVLLTIDDCEMFVIPRRWITSILLFRLLNTPEKQRFGFVVALLSRFSCLIVSTVSV